MKDAQITLPELWQQMMVEEYSMIDALVADIEGDDLTAKAQLFLENQENTSLFPHILLYGMALKEHHPQIAARIEDNIIKTAIVKMAQADKLLHEVYKIAVDEILSIPADVSALLQDSVLSIQSEYREWQAITLLHIAARDGRSEIIKLLNAGNADVNCLDKHGLGTPLHIAMHDNQMECVDALLSCDSINIHAGPAGSEPIIMAIRDTSNWSAFATKFKNAEKLHHVTQREMENISCVIQDILEHSCRAANKYDKLCEITRFLEEVLGDISCLHLEHAMESNVYEME